MPTTLPIDLLASSDLGSSSTDNLTNDDTPTLEGFAGVALFGATVDFTSSLDGVLGSTTVGSDGTWQMTLPQLSQGNNWITATITAPDTSVTTETIELDIDTYAAITIDQPASNNGLITGLITGAFTLSGTTTGVNDGQTVDVTITDVNNNSVTRQAVVDGGQWVSSNMGVSGETRVNTYTTGSQSEPSVTALADGGYLVVWSSDGQDGDGYGVYSQRYAADGSLVGNEKQVNTYTVGKQSDASVTGLLDGGYLVTWTSANQDGDSDGVFAQRYNAAGNTVGSEMLVNSTTVGNQYFPVVTNLSDGGFVIAWVSSQDGNSTNVYSQRYSAAGDTVGADTVTLATADSWAAQGSQVIDGVTFEGYDSGSASLLIEQGINVQIV